MAKRRGVLLTEAERLRIERIREAAEKGKKGTEIARELHMPTHAVYKIIKDEGIKIRTNKQILLEAFEEMPEITNTAVLAERTGLNKKQIEKTAGKLRKEYPDKIPKLTSFYEVWNVKTGEKVILGENQARTLELIPIFGIDKKGREAIGKTIGITDIGVISTIRQLRKKGFDIRHERVKRIPKKTKILMLEYEEAANAIKRHVDNAPEGEKFVPLDSEHAKKLRELEKAPELAEFRAERDRVAKYYYDLGLSYKDAAKLADMSVYTLSKRINMYGYPKRKEIMPYLKGKKKKSKKSGRSEAPTSGQILMDRLLKKGLPMPDSMKEAAKKKQVELASKAKKRAGKR